MCVHVHVPVRVKASSCYSLKPTVIKDINQNMTVVPGSTASWDPERDPGRDNSNQTHRWCFTARYFLFPGVLWLTYRLCGVHWTPKVVKSLHFSFTPVVIICVLMSTFHYVSFCNAEDAHQTLGEVHKALQIVIIFWWG